jgi:hypothetical protein
MADEVISRLVLAWDAGAMGRLPDDQLGVAEEGHGGVRGESRDVPHSTNNTSTSQAKIGGGGPTFIRQTWEKCFNASCATAWKVEIMQFAVIAGVGVQTDQST